MGSGGEAKQLSSKTIIAIAVVVSASLAIGLGVGLGLGLQKVVYIPATDTTTKPPEKETTTAAPTPVPGDGPWLNYRLPDYIIPSHYKLTLHPDMNTNIYNGTNEMTFKVHQNTEYVLIHAHESLEIDESSVTLQWKDGEKLVSQEIVKKFRYPEFEFYVIQVKDVLLNGQEFILTVEFSNRLDEASVGIFKSTYTDPGDGSQKDMVASDMQPTNARRGYPCFDEPSMKIRYKTSIIHESKYTALSNMLKESTKDYPGGLNITEFEETVPMSTYIGCFIVCDFGYVEAYSKRNVRLRIYASQHHVDNNRLDYALNVTKILLDKYEDLLKVNYSLPKYDQIAIPNLLNFGAMENWGLVTFRESYLVWDSEESSTADRQRVAAVIAHEMVHQWFGNIVTLEWWSNLWLNEGFASYLEYKGLEWAEPDWRWEGHHVIDDVQRAMRFDALSASHPLVVNVSTPAQISEVFDLLSYQKGSSILKMMHNILGDDLFFGGLTVYLRNKSFSNANEQDLWINVQKYVDENGGGFNIKEIMDPWVQQMGFPIVSVSKDSATTGAATQDLFQADASVVTEETPASPYEYKWKIKLDYYTQNNSSREEQWFPMNSNHSFKISDIGDWWKFNYLERGYYRVHYEPDIWQAFVAQLKADVSAIPDLDRCHLLDDAFNFAPVKTISYTTALNLTTYLDKEESFFVWTAFSYGSSYISSMLASTEHNANFKRYYLTRVKPIADKLGWDATSGTHEEKRNRPLVLSLALSYGDMEALNNASKLFQDWRNGSSIHPDVRQLVYRYGIVNGDTSDWEYMLERYLTETVATEKTNLLRGLAATENVALIDRLLEYSMNDSIIKDQDFFNCLTYISYSVNGNKMTWSWVRVNWDYMVERFTLSNRGLGRIIPTIVNDYNTQLKKWEVESFFESKPDAGAGEAARVNALSQIDLNIAWLATNKEPIGQWLQERVNELP